MSDLVLFALGGVAMLLVFLLKERLIGFAAQRPADYLDGAPELDIQRHLNGPLACEGVIYGPFGRVSARFVATMQGTWDGNTGRLVEEFKYDGGSQQRREWLLTCQEDGTFVAVASDVVGVGRGVQMGSAVRLTYQIKLTDSVGGHRLEVTDWLYLLENGALVNRSQMRKFGFKVAELVATIRPVAR